MLDVLYMKCVYNVQCTCTYMYMYMNVSSSVGRIEGMMGGVAWVELVTTSKFLFFYSSHTHFKEMSSEALLN